MLSYARPHMWSLILLSCAAVLGVTAELCIPIVMKTLLDGLTRHGSTAVLGWACTLLACTVGSTIVLSGLRQFLGGCVSERVQAEIRTGISLRLRTLPFTHFQNEQTGRIMALITTDAPAMAKMFYPIYPDMLVSLLQVLGVIVVLVWLYGPIASLALAAALVYAVPPILVSAKLRHAASRLHGELGELSAGVHESLAGRREVIAFDRDNWDHRRWSETFRRVIDSQLRVIKLQITSSANGVLYWAIVGTLYYIVGQRVLAGQLSLGGLVAFIWYFSLIDGPGRRLSNVNSQLQTALGAAVGVLSFVGREPVASPRHAANGAPEPILGRVEFEDVEFTYPSGTQALKGVTFAIEHAQRVAIVGASGAGKTTIAALIARLYSPTRGRILVDNREISSIDVHSFRRQVSPVFQDTFLFHGTVRENIRFGCLEASDAEITIAAQIANAHAFISALPQQYETMVGERGAALSGGQRQRIAIARAVLQRPRILILDEATSALDSVSEELVQDSLLSLLNGCTIIVIAHRLSTVLSADLAMVVDNGRIVDQGNHKELIRRSLPYQRLFGAETMSVDLPFMPTRDASGTLHQSIHR